MATVSMLVLLYSLVAAEANTGTGTGCYNVETHQCDCTVSESTCHARGGTWTDTCRSCDSTTNEQHPDCQRQYSWGCFDEASHACQCTVSERACDAAAGKTWTHECWSCCHGSSWGCFVPGSGPESGCHCNLHETSCSVDFPDATWSHQCFDCDVDAETSAAGRPTGFVVALLVLLSGFFLADANTGTGTGCYNVETHQCDCAVSESTCHARGGTWTDTCRSCDSTTNEQHPDCQRQYSWGCFDEASHACECTVSEKTCEAAAGKTWTHECWSCCHGSSWGCFVPGSGPESGCHCNLHETSCSVDFPDATWSHQCFDCDVDAETSAAGRPTGFVVALLVLLSGFFLADANTGTGTGCYDVETHRCDCTVTETQCLARQGHWTDTCRSCDATTNEQHPDCQRQYSWGCFDEASHACQCTVSERACDAAAGKTWTHECWSCCHGSAWGCFVPGTGPESGCHCNLYEGACALDFPDATWSHQCFECEEDAVQKDEAASDDGGVGVAVAVSVSVTVVVVAACIGIYCLWAKMIKPKPVNEPYNSPQFNQSDVVVGLAVPGSAPSPAATTKEVA